VRTLANGRRQFEFCFPDLDTLVLVEEFNERLVIRSTRDTFSEKRKICFIHWLASEGFISESYQWYSDSESAKWLRVQWWIDYSWLKLDATQIARTRRFMVGLLIGAGLLWLGMMAALLSW